MPTPCAPDKHEMHWYPATNEDGWRCCHCEHKPGEPPGFSPQLDRELIRSKVWALVHDLHGAGIVYVSNSSHGDAIEAAVANRCEAEGVFDQYSIAAFILDTMTASHAKYWREISDGILAGKDPRERCWCGALATSFGSRGHRCSAHWNVHEPYRGPKGRIGP